jgi:DNA-binding winged helix-turn-helix (wHTH) protein/tetratricopeptide (TPR) repeat protein
MDAGRRLLLRGGEAVPLTPKAFETLLLLVRRQGEVLDKRELMETLWPDTAVEENNLNQNISALRRVFGEARGENRFIATVPGKGYCFTADVRGRGPEAVEERGHIRLAVLPFENLGAGVEREYLADGLTEETIATIGQIDAEHVSVIGRTSVMAYKRTLKPIVEIGLELDATHLLESSLRAEGERLRITSRLIRVRDQSQIWSASFDSEPSSLLAFQRELSVAIAEQVRLRLSPARLTALAKRQTQNAEAYDLYLRGRHLWNQLTGPTTRRAMEYFTRATTLDKRYALAWAGLADCYSSGPVHGDVEAAVVAPLARAAAEAAVLAEPNLAEAHTSIGSYHFWISWDWLEAEAAYRRAIALDSNFPLAHRMLGVVLSHSCRHEEARVSMQRARELDPLYVMHQSLSSQIAFAAREYETALHFAKQALIVDPEFWIAQLHLAQVSAELGEFGVALEALNKAVRLSGGNSKTMALRGYVLAQMGQRAEAAEILGTMEEVARQRYVPPYTMALLHAACGDREKAMDWLERVREAGDVHMVFVPIDAKWDAFRGESRFVRLMAGCAFSRAIAGRP